MDVILQKDYPQLGFTGEKLSVKNGFARNYLIPRGLAVEINRNNEKFIKNKLASIASSRAKLLSEAREIGARMAAENLQFSIKIGKKGKSFGSLSAREIFDELTKRGYLLNRRQVVLTDTIKLAGNFTCQVRLHSEFTADIPVRVVAEKASSKDEETEEHDSVTTEVIENADKAE
jgi:large subunit ribosomal protein L9